MSYTLRGRIESRLAASLLPFLVASALAAIVQAWWPIELAGLMLAVGLTLDGAVLHRLLAYQPAWAALPLGLIELALVMLLVRLLALPAPPLAALAFFAGSWLSAQILVQAGLPRLHLSYGEDGGELGRGGVLLGGAAPALLALVTGVAWVTQPPTVHLAAGVHQGPLVLARAQTLVGEPGAIVRGGIVVTADDVTVRGVSVTGGEHGIEVDGARRVRLEDVSITASLLDGIHARGSSVSVRDCTVHGLAGDLTQGIDISFGMGAGRSSVEGCTVIGGAEGIVSHLAQVAIRKNRVSGTTGRAIAVTEMSNGLVERNEVSGALGVGIFCGDYSMCRIERNVVVGTRRDARGGRTRGGYAIEAHYGASALVAENRLTDNAARVAAFINAEVREAP
ncbi:MAG: right-handed parallel beta-helix repeat-containing protein [Actinobacteria bacterium]|nr:right-handed parallel beta-helix repeat-containing protein [Actinomycetota bacterium]